MRKMAGRFRGSMWAVMAAILLLFPNSASMLCIAPGGHVEIEDINSSCCASAHLSGPAPQQGDNRFNAAGACNNCTDLFLTPNGRGAISESYSDITAGASVFEYLGDQRSADTAVCLFSQGAISNNIDARNLICSSIPLRC